MITDAAGDLLDDDADALVNGVNLGGVMGRSLALQFKRRFPEMFREHERMARRGELQMGRVHVWATGEPAPRFVVNVPTKRHWRSKVQLADVEQALADLVRAVAENGITSIAVPALGCGSGGLQWSDVRPLVERAFAILPEVEVRMYGPGGRSALTEEGGPVRRPAMTPTKAAIVTLAHRYGAVAPEVTVLEVQRLVYFLQEAGQDLRLTYARGRYGPVAEDLRHVLAPMEGAFLTGYGDGTRPAASTDVIELLPDAVEQASFVVAASPTLAARIDRVLALARGFESPYGLELLATAHWVATRHEGVGGDLQRIAALVAEGSEREDRMFTEAHVASASEQLAAEGWLGPRPKVAASSRA